MRQDRWKEYAKAGGELPAIGPICESFWAGYHGWKGARQGVPGSVQRMAFNAGKARAKAEPGIKH